MSDNRKSLSDKDKATLEVRNKAVRYFFTQVTKKRVDVVGSLKRPTIVLDEKELISVGISGKTIYFNSSFEEREANGVIEDVFVANEEANFSQYQSLIDKCAKKPAVVLRLNFNKSLMLNDSSIISDGGYGSKICFSSRYPKIYLSIEYAQGIAEKIKAESGIEVTATENNG